MQIDGVACFVARLVNFQRDAVRTDSTFAVAIILPAVTCPETDTAYNIVFGVAHFKTVRTPLHRESDFACFARREIQFLFRFY
ncbi:hypothetical protein D3C75_736130 [compost metagenome]